MMFSAANLKQFYQLCISSRFPVNAFAVCRFKHNSQQSQDHTRFPVKIQYGTVRHIDVLRKRSFSVSTRSSTTTSLGRERAAQESTSSEGECNDGVRPFSSIPGPKPLPFVGNKLLFTSIGGYSFETFWSTCWMLYFRFGHIVRISNVATDLDMVLLFRPDDTRKIFQNEGPYPIRPPLDILKHYRKKRPHLFTSSGVVPGNGPEWRRLRTSVQILLKRDLVRHYKQDQSSIADDFVNLLSVKFPFVPSSASNGHVVPDLLPILFRYTLEAVGVVALGSRLGCLDTENDNSHMAHSIISANEESLRAMGESLFKLPLHKIFPTRLFLRLSEAQDVIAKTVKHHLGRHQESWSNNPMEFSSQNPFLAALMEQQDLTDSDLFLLLVEVFQGGIDATATSLAFCIYHLSLYEETQTRLFEEVKDVNPSTHDLQGLKYLRAVLQETFRLNPSAASNGRILPHDTVFSGYNVPAGTLVTSPPIVASHNKAVFSDPFEFRPERWLSKRRMPNSLPSDPQNSKDKLSDTKKIHPYTVLPFGHGARMCPGRRLAEQEIFILLIQLVKSFKMEQIDPKHPAKVGQVMRLNMMPDGPIGIRFVPRT